MEKDVETVVEASETLKRMNKGRYREKILDFCLSKHGMSHETTNSALDEAIQQQKLYTTVVHGKQSYRKYDEKIYIEDDQESCYTQTDPTTEKQFITKQDFERFVIDFEDFKRYMQCEMLSIKADVANRQRSYSPPKTPDKDREALVRTLNERILSLEKQLNEKQYVIQKLFDRPSQNLTTSFHEIPNGQKHNASQKMYPSGQTHNISQTTTNEEQKEKPSNNSKSNLKTPTTKKETSKGAATNINANSKQQQPDPNITKAKQTTGNTRKRVTIVGDSILNGIYEEGLQKSHNVRVKPHSGATTTDIVDYLKPVIRKKPDCIIIHAGTNDLTNNEQIDTLANFKTMIENIRNNSPETVIALSNVVIRKDKAAKEKKVSVTNLNKKIKELAKVKKIELIDNSNLDTSCLSRRMLHMNDKGNSYLANNFINFMRTL